MRKKQTRSLQGQTARETAVGRGFVLWLALYAILVLSLFAFNMPGKPRLEQNSMRISHSVHQPETTGLSAPPSRHM